MFMAAFIHSSQKLETIQKPKADAWVNKVWYIHTTEYYSVTKRNEMLVQATA